MGCVYTAQGFEYDWNGVIFGGDLVWRTDRWVAVRKASKDPELKSSKALDDDGFAALVLHVYKVLLTRGLIGTLLYSVDEETERLLADLVIASK